MNDEDAAIFEIFPWHENFNTDISIIDEQHKKLVYLLNILAAHLANRSNSLALNKVFDDLAEYADYHFKTEEKICLRTSIMMIGFQLMNRLTHRSYLKSCY